MTDRELLEMAAKAAGRDVIWKCGMHQGAPHEGLFDRCTGHVTNWNPLADDGDALRLAVKLRLDVSINGDIHAAWWHGDSLEFVTESLGDDNYSATRRAIVRAAAEIGRAMQ